MTTPKRSSSPRRRSQTVGKNTGLPRDAKAELREALAQQAATSEILQVISRARSDVQPVFDAIARKAADLCRAKTSAVYRFDGELIHLVAHHSFSPEAIVALRQTFPMPPGRGGAIARAILSRAVAYIPDVRDDPEYRQHTVATAVGYLSILAVPMLHEGHTIGAIAVTGSEPRTFSQRQIELLQTFADQAVIAIENVRLFTELQGKNQALIAAHAQVTEALDQQTATSEILRVISSSPTDVQPVFEAIVENAARLFRAWTTHVFGFDGRFLHLGAVRGPIHHSRTLAPIRPSLDLTVGRCALARSVIHIADVDGDPDASQRSRQVASLQGWRSALAAPMMRDGQLRGVIMVTRASAGAFDTNEIELLKTFADQAVIAIENVRLFTELQEKNRALTQAHAQMTEALDQQTATSEILRVISSSPTDIQPVFDAIVESAVRLCEARYGAVFSFDGELLRFVAHYSLPEAVLEAVRRQYPMRPSRAAIAGRAVTSTEVVQIPDVTLDPDINPNAARAGVRGLLAVPILRAGAPIGAIVIYRLDPGSFPDQHISLVKTFADQAVIAIENARLFQELQTRNEELTSALARQTATSEILQVISRSPTATEPVFEAIVKSASQLLGGTFAVLTTVRESALHLAAYQLPGAQTEAIRQWLRTYPRPLDDESQMARVVRTGQVVSVADAHADPEPPALLTAIRRLPIRGIVMMPMLRDGQGIGCIVVARPTVGAFTDVEVALLRTFADQAVIAIENVRLFTELQEKNQALIQANAQVTEALDQQTATSEILRVISSSPTDVQPVFDAIVASAARLCEATFSVVFLHRDGQLALGSVQGVNPEGIAALRQTYPRPVGRESATGRAVVDQQLVHVVDAKIDTDYTFPQREVLGIRSILAVPMVREGSTVGAIGVWRNEVRPFTDKQIALLRTFADQAVIAIENGRLFQELQTRTRELGRSVEELQALGEVSRAVSSTLDLETVLNTIVARAVQLAAANGGLIYEYDEATEEFNRISGAHRLDLELGEVIRAAPIRLGEGVAGAAAARRAPIQVPDVLAERAYDVARVRAVFERRGYRAVLGVPLLSERRIIGVLVVWRREPGIFAGDIVNLLQTFATQSVLAIRNAQLYRELEEKGRQLEAASRHKSEFLANMSHELRTPLNAILGFNEMVLGEIYGEVSSSMREPLTDIQNSGKHLLRLINNVLDLSKIEAGRMELSPADYSVQDIVERVRASLHPLAVEKGLEFVASVPADIPLAYGDGGRITQCLMNLAGNALKFTRQGRVEIAVELQGENLVYHVRDTGIGIAKDKIDSLFTEFRQGDATITSEFGGTGLGLSISRKFVEMHGGRIWVESGPGKGSTFSFSVPLRLAGVKAA
jgi:GAF domain-containing protein